MFIDFQALKQRVSVEDVAVMLNLTITRNGDNGQQRGPCPHCKEGGERALVVSPGKGYYCFAAQGGGDCIALAAHIRGLSMKDAAGWIVEQLDGERDTKPEEPQPAPQESNALQPLAYLHYNHEAVQALGIDVDTAEALGIGYAKKGMMRGRVAIPIRKADGPLVGYCGFAPDADPPLKFPKTLTPQ